MEDSQYEDCCEYSLLIPTIVASWSVRMKKLALGDRLEVNLEAVLHESHSVEGSQLKIVVNVVFPATCIVACFGVCG